jgi:hypothetical protein
VQVLQLFRPADAHAPSLDELVALVSALPGVEIEGRPGDAHRLARWRDADTGAAGLLQVGEPPLELDTMHPPRAYRGWAPLALSLHVPLSGPHWFCVEALRVCESLLAADPVWRALDEEDIPPSPSGDAGPVPWSRPRAIASWERLRAAQIETSAAVPRMRRSASVAMWRYRREAPTGGRLHPGFHWPPVSAMRDASGAARSACVWMEPGRPLALPPVELVLIAGGAPRLIAYDDLAIALGEAGGLSEAGIAGAALVGACPDAERLSQAARPAAGMVALDDDSWCD